MTLKQQNFNHYSINIGFWPIISNSNALTKTKKACPLDKPRIFSKWIHPNYDKKIILACVSADLSAMDKSITKDEDASGVVAKQASIRWR